MNSRIADLRRRIEKDPASIVFAQLAEEYRRAGEYDDAIRVCQAGLVHHPGYFSARVTLGRALMATGALEEAEAEFEHVLRAAPHNLGATRALEELRQRRGTEDGERGTGEVSVVNVKPPEFPGVIPEISTAQPARPDVEPLLADPRSPLPTPHSPVFDPVLVELESWLAAIVADRQRRSA